MMPLTLLLSVALAADPETEAELARTRAEVAELQAEIARLRSEGEAAAHAYAGQDGDVVIPAGTVADHAVSLAGDVRVDGHVTGNATSVAGDVIIGPTGVVDGDAVAIAGDVVVLPGGTLAGNRVGMEMDLPVLDGRPAEPGLFDRIYRRIVLILSFAGAGVLTVGVFPKRVAHVAAAVERRPAHSVFVGGLSTFFVALLSVLVTVLTLGLGFPVAVVLLGALGVAWLLGFMGLCQAVGDRLPFDKRPHGRWVAFLVGVLLVTSIASLPWVGSVVLVGVGLLGVGASLSTRYGATPA